MPRNSVKAALVIVMASIAGEAHADVVLNFTPTMRDMVPGGTVEFVGTLTNTGTTDVYLNGDVIVLPYPNLTVDDSPFFTNSPLFLPGGGAYTGPFIDVMADLSILPGEYSGSYRVQGGADANMFDDLATQAFTVDVVAAPEPNSFTLLVSALMGVALVYAGARGRLRS
jgi:hypothetical protein